MLKDKEIKVLGAFLHDIGKFIWRSKPLKAGDNHEKLGSEFIREYLGKIEILSDDIEKIIDAANRNDVKIKRADGAVASERTAELSQQTRRPLISIFSKIDIGKEYKSKGVYYYNPVISDSVSKLSYLDGVTTESWKVDDAHYINLHNELFGQFTKELMSLNHFKEFKPFFRTFYKLCEKYTSFISSASFKSTPDISLFDHSRNVAGLTLCYIEADREKECLLIKGDLSGIQNFLYKEIEESERAAKQLRGRSFYITLLTETITNYLLSEFESFDTSILFNSGGHFVIIIPNNEINRRKYVELEAKINRILFKLLEGKIQCVMSFVECKGSDLFVDFASVYKELEKVNQREKKRKSISIIDELFFDEISTQKNYDGVFEIIGQKLPHSDYIIEVYSSKTLKLNNSKAIYFNDFGITYIFAETHELESALAELNSQNIEYAIINKIGDTDLLKQTQISKNLINKGIDYEIGNGFWSICNYIPFKDKRPMSFEELAKLDRTKSGLTGELSYPQLGILRMDVDSLGLIFSEGLKGDKSISRVSTLSRLMSHFFAMRVSKVAENNNIYVVYSGGDDLLAVGSWMNVIHFSKELSKEFDEYTCINPNVTISGGIVIVRDNFPISKGSILAGDKEETAKKSNDGKKDSISVFEREVTWNELSEMIAIAEGIDNNLDYGQSDKKKTISRSFLYHLLELTKEVFDKKGKFDINKVHSITHKLAYQFARNGVNHNEIEKRTLGFKTDLANYFLSNDKTKLEKWYHNFQIPASYVLLKTRNSKENNYKG